MSLQDIPPGIEATYDAAYRGWRCWIPLDVIEANMHRQGLRFEKLRPYEPPPDGRPVAAQVAKLLALPSRVQLEVRVRVARNNRRRFGP